MTVPVQTPYNSYTYAGSTTFVYGFQIILATDLQVSVAGVIQPAANYTISGVGNQTGGSINYTGTLTIGQLVELQRVTVLMRANDYQNEGDFLAATINADFDRLWMALQESQRANVQAIRVPEAAGVPVLPAAPSRISTLLGFDLFGALALIPAAIGSAAALALQYAGTTGATFIGFRGSNVDAELAALKANDADAMQAFAIDIGAGTAATAAVFGDSTMWGADPANLANQVAIPPPAQLQNFVNNFNGNSALTVINAAISGTTAAQMLAGTDGSGSTFQARINASSARIVYCNHGVNDAFGANSTSAATYRANLVQIVRIIRAAGKTPVLITPHPCLTIGTFGSQARAEATARFAQIMREVAAQHGVPLVDNNILLSRLLNIDGQLPLSVLPDGVHGPQSTYAATGNNLASSILGGQAETLSRAGQRIAASSAGIRATGQTISTSTTSRVGSVTTSGTASPQTLRMVFQVDQTGLDLVLAHPIFSNGSANISISLDGTVIGTMSQLAAGFAASFLQDVETVIARNIPVGFHILIFTTSSVGAVGVHYLRARDAEKPLMLPIANAVPTQRTLLAKKLTLDNSSVVNTMMACDTMPASRFIDTLEFEWTMNAATNCGVIIGANVGSNVGTASCERILMVYLDVSGFLTIAQATAPGTYTVNNLDAVNHSGVSHLYRVSIAPAGLLTAFIDDVQIGTLALTTPCVGGLFGIWKNVAASVFTVTDFCRVWRL